MKHTGVFQEDLFSISVCFTRYCTAGVRTKVKILWEGHKIWKKSPKAHSLSKKFCTMICFSKNEQLMSALAGWKGLVRMIRFSKNEDHAELFTQWMDFSLFKTKRELKCQFSGITEILWLTFWHNKRSVFDVVKDSS